MKKLIPLVALLIIAVGFKSIEGDKEVDVKKLRTEIERLNNEINSLSPNSKGQLFTFMTFQEDNAEEAMNFYMSLFDNSQVTSIERYGSEGPAKEGTVMFATFELNGIPFACSDSYIQHEWDFTPAVSVFVECKSDEELQTLFSSLSKDGQIYMPLGNYGFSKQFGFVEDRFGVSWQLNLN